MASKILDEDSIDVITNSGFTPLHIAAYYGNEIMAELLLEKGADVNFPALQNISALHVASKWGRVNLVSLLLSRGASVDSRDADSLTPLHYACWFRHCEVVKIILEKSVGSPAKIMKTRWIKTPHHVMPKTSYVNNKAHEFFSCQKRKEISIEK